jgi:nucleotide-binding universal stress UspA family protein
MFSHRWKLSCNLRIQLEADMDIHGPILVALDGSESAERVLPSAEALAGALRTHLVIVSVLEGQSGVAPAMEVELEHLGREHFESYLDAVRERLGRPETRVTVRVGDAADEILACASETKAGVIAIASHGRSAVNRWMYGSTASALTRRSDVPLLVVGPHATGKSARKISHVMVPLDGSDAAGEVVEAARKIADSKLSLVRVVQWAIEAYPYTLPESYVPALDKELEQGASEYMHRQKDLVGGDVRTYVIRGGGTASRLMEFVEREDVDLVVMSTHGRTGVARTALGSTADRMIQATVPVLLVPVRPVSGSTTASEKVQIAV